MSSKTQSSDKIAFPALMRATDVKRGLHSSLGSFAGLFFSVRPRTETKMWHPLKHYTRRRVTTAALARMQWYASGEFVLALAFVGGAPPNGHAGFQRGASIALKLGVALPLHIGINKAPFA